MLKIWCFSVLWCCYNKIDVSVFCWNLWKDFEGSLAYTHSSFFPVMTNSKPQCTLLSESCSLNVWVHFIQISYTHSYEYLPPGERIEISALVCQLKRLCQFQWKWSSKSKPWYTFLSESYSLNAWVHLIQTLHTHSCRYSPPGERIELSVSVCQP